MDITVYDKLYEALKVDLEKFNAKSGFNAQICTYAPDKPKYPLIIFSEVRNQPNNYFYGGREKVSSLGYRVDIFAKTAPVTTTVTTKGAKPKTVKPAVNKQQTCRELMQFVTDFMENKMGFELISNNYNDSAGTQGELYQQMLVFQQNYYENKEMFLRR